ncbi:hypothetical protein BBF96_06825 [Anoxybacter fermentans]|uniref:Zinc finger DksA/TraR C4-type domain-containing protein n=1 Tax=Anoxybacter fermentans TaxID=1323375 RepID=A0A3Q9HQ92_9FIRM|nr:TraR/DksA C4-type zinc finger protein [Anoxybacter fermentans]AZR73122.1 hypothetical protein BBF96_06825 [Anoxybacter fermentans]
MVFVFRTCIHCGRAINWERLEVLPETHCCVHCAEEYGTDINISPTKIGMDLDTYKDLLGAVRS